VNVSAGPQQARLKMSDGSSAWKDLFGGQAARSEAGMLMVNLAPYQVLWLAPD